MNFKLFIGLCCLTEAAALKNLSTPMIIALIVIGALNASMGLKECLNAQKD
jgi:hypothetical protein